VAVGEAGSPRNNSSSLRRGLRLLRCVADGPADGMTLADLAKAADLPKSTVVRLLPPLVGEGLLAYAGARYRLGPSTASYGGRYLEGLDVRTAARGPLERLAAGSGETAHLVLLDGTEVVYVDKVESSSPVRMYSRIGIRRPLYCTAVGKALLERHEDDLLPAVVADGLQRLTPHTLVTEQALREDLARIRRRGYALDDGENEPGIRCVAAAVTGSSGTAFAALSVSGPAGRVTKARSAELGALVRTAAAEVSSAFGAR
jgi:IclR family transcriptional regulator, acetate operon repressor